jgi:two-component system chemotaxis sensor kinase CheA
VTAGDGAPGAPAQVYAVPLEAIEETVIAGRGEARTVNGRPCLVLRDRIVPLVWLAGGGDGDADRLDVVVVTLGAVRLGLVVDRLVGKQEVVIKHLPDFLGEVPGVAGATILGDGSVALIVDVAAVAASAGITA